VATGRRSAGDAVAEIETEKAAAEFTTETARVLLPAVAAGDTAPIGAPLAIVGATLAAAAGARDAAALPAPPALAVARGVDLDEVRPSTRAPNTARKSHFFLLSRSAMAGA
jgi:pyruvate/2-oxoglutarate dehydrogenase complex dihydrolipoamide acyltransferase (E2) component